MDFSSVEVVVRFYRTKLLIEVKKGLLCVIYILMMVSVKCCLWGGGGEVLPPTRTRGGITLLPPE